MWVPQRGSLLLLLLLSLGGADAVAALQGRASASAKTGRLAEGTDASARVGANPIRRVITMLEMMQKKVEEEGVKEKELFDKFRCYCASSGGELTDAIENAKVAIPQLEAKIKAGEAEKEQLEEDLARHRNDREEANQALATATGIREKEAAAYEKESEETGANLDALASAIAAIENGMAGAFLQTPTGRRFSKGMRAPSAAGGLGATLSGTDRETVAAFLDFARKAAEDSAEKSAIGEGYAPASGEIVGILKQLKDSMENDLGELQQTEKEAKAAYAELTTAKKQEIEAATAAIEDKSRRAGEVAVEVVQSKDELDDTIAGLSEDEQFKLNLDKSCDAKKKEWALRQQTRAEELKALSETILILTGDGGMKLLTKTLAGSGEAAELVQETASEKAAGRNALTVLRGCSRTFRSPRLDFITFALQGKKVGFEQVIRMIDEMVQTLGTEQKDDDEKREYCTTELDVSDDRRKATEHSIESLNTQITDAEEGVQSLTDEIKALGDGVLALDKSVAVATKTRKQENSAYVKLMSDNQAAVDLIDFAKNRMNQFYNPKLAKPMPKEQAQQGASLLSVRQHGEVGSSGTQLGLPMGEANLLARGAAQVENLATPKSGRGAGAPASLAQLATRLAHRQRGGATRGSAVRQSVSVAAQKEETQAAPPPPPETFGEYEKKSEESNGAIAMMTMLQGDLRKEMSEAVAEERDAQEDYETLMADSQAKRAQDSKSITDKEDSKAALVADLVSAKDGLRSSKKDLESLRSYIGDLHADCDFLLENYELRQRARAEEMDGLKKAKAILSGADYSLAQSGMAPAPGSTGGGFLA